MTRPPRIDPQMGWHHVTNHVAGSDELFPDDEHRHLFIRLLVWASARTRVEVVGFSLMGNHFHLLLFCPDGRLSEFMHLVESVYARAYSTHRGCRGPVFVNRFHNTVIMSDEQLLMTARYIDRNALELGLDIERYPWSSYLTHVNGGGAHDSALAKACEIPVRLAGGRAAYHAFVRTDGHADRFSISDGRRAIAATPYRPIEETLTELAMIAAAATGTNVAALISRSPGARSGARLATVFVAHKVLVASHDEMGEFFRYRARTSLASAIARSRRKYSTHVEFKALVDQIEAAWQQRALAKAS